MSINIFEKAARLKLRFDTAKGQLSAEDLWDLPLTSERGVNLDDIARALHVQMRSSEDVSFVNPGQRSDPTVQLRFDIAKHVIDVRLAENAAAATAAANKEKKQRLLEIIDRKENAALEALDIAALREQVEAL